MFFEMYILLEIQYYLRTLKQCNPINVYSTSNTNASSDKRINSLLDNGHTFFQLSLIDDQRRRKPNDVSMGRFGQQSVLSQSQTHFPRVEFGADDDGVEQTATANCFHHFRVHLGHLLAENLACKLKTITNSVFIITF